jgi:acetyl esterase/lipase
VSAQLDPDAAALLEVMRAGGAAQPYELSPDQAREQMRASLLTRGEPLALQEVRDLRLPSPNGPLCVRLYRPSAGVLPTLLFLHGGGWVLNDLDTHDRVCRRLARRSGCMLAALHYRRAPEHRHPAALEDALLAYRWLTDNSQLIGGAARVGVCGESSGATTVACMTLLLRDLGAPMPALVALAYPLADISEQWPSFGERGQGYSLDVDFIRWSLQSYLPDGHDPADPYLAPLHADELEGLPPTIVMTAEFDPLRDGGIAYVRKLQAAGVTVEHIHATDQMHGFLLLDRVLPKAGELMDRLADAIASRIGSRTCQSQPARL